MLAGHLTNARKLSTSARSGKLKFMFDCLIPPCRDRLRRWRLSRARPHRLAGIRASPGSQDEGGL